MGIARFVLNLVLGIALTLAVQLYDKRRLLTPEQRARSWNFASWGAALYAFGPLSLLGWGWVTRRWTGLLLAVVCIVVIGAFVTGADRLFALAFDLPLD